MEKVNNSNELTNANKNDLNNESKKTIKEEKYNVFNDKIITSITKEELILIKFYFDNDILKLEKESEKDKSIIELSYICLCENDNNQYFTNDVLERIILYKNGVRASTFRYIYNININDIQKSLRTKCKQCAINLSRCPQKLLAYILYISKSQNLNAKYIIDTLYNNLFAVEEVSNIENDINSIQELSYLAKLDKISLMGASVAIRNKLIKDIIINGPIVSYDFIDNILDNKTVFLHRILNKEYILGTININDIDNELKNSNNSFIFKLNPIKIAAYILYLSQKYNVKPESILNRFKIDGRTQRDELFYRSTQNIISQLPYDDEVKENLNKFLVYMSTYYKEKFVLTYIPFNIIIYTKDDYITRELSSIISYIIWYYGYIKNNESSRFKHIDINKLLIRYTDFNDLYSKTEPCTLYISNFCDITSFRKEEDIVYSLNLFFAELEAAKNKIITIINGDEQEIESIMFKRSARAENYFNFRFKVKDLSKEKVKQLIIDKLSYVKKVPNSFERILEKYINNTYDSGDTKNYEYINNLYNKILFNSSKNILDNNALPDFEEDRDIEDILKELNSLTGLSNIKKQIQDLVYILTFNKKLEGVLNINKMNLHMIFTGNPGTGKTTVARLLSELLYKLGYIKKNKLVEVQSKDLIGEYIGQTGPRTYKAIQSALDGVLFIDEAYSIMGHEGSANYTQECISVLNKCMEDYKDRIIIIFAGYKNEMQTFVDLNPGLVSRIGYTIQFEEYTQTELEEIFIKEFEKNGFIVDEDAKAEAAKIILEARKLNNFGNARFIIKFYQDVIVNHAINTNQINDINILKTIRREDISPKILTSIGNNKNKLGFMQ